jgi:lysophospholipid acyltransferase (LPLAT)-like uncharacterized protein
MARAPSGLIVPPAAAFGWLVAAYSRAVARSASVEIIPETPLPQSPTLWISWHENNLITLALHRRVTGRAAMAFVPPGVQGIAMSTWLSGVGVTPVPLAPDARRGLGLRQMEAALASGKDVLIAVDGPTGPRHGIAPGAMWLARATDVGIRPAGCWASPALRLPRWDRLIVPLPRARIAMALGSALPKQTSAEAIARLAATLQRLNEQARAEVTARPNLTPEEAVPWT